MAKNEKKNIKKDNMKNVVDNKSYFQQIKEELKKVKWPEKKDMVKFSVATLVFILLFGLYFYGLDAIFAWFKELIG